jgi:inner membrane protein
MAEWTERLSNSMRHSQTLRLVTVAVLVLVLLIPIGMIRGLIAERQQRQSGAVDEIASKWGGIQQVVGPYLVVPYTEDVIQATEGGKTIERRFARHAVFLADSLTTTATLQTETRRRGIYSVPVYRMELLATGTFTRPDFAALGITPTTVGWDRIQLVYGISDTRAIQASSSVKWAETEIPMLPGSGTLPSARSAIHAVVDFPDASAQVPFALPLTLNGSRGVYFVPFGKSTELRLKSDFPHPSFQGNWLPTDRSVTHSGFDAQWSIPFLGRSFPQAWTASDKPGLTEIVEGARFGVDLSNPVDHYSMADRSVKYAGLFILLTFATLWIFEVRAAVRVHPIQFLMLGGALCLFYLLLLSISEHMAFPSAYVIASIAVIAMVASYGLIVLGAATRAIAIGVVVALLYGYLYILLVNEDYALLIGSIGLFLMLAAIMYATRKVDWYAVGEKSGR